MIKQKALALLLVLGAMLMLTASNLEADFIQCVGSGSCNGTLLNDIINGTHNSNLINGLDGNDTIFAADNPTDPCLATVDKEPVGGLMFGVSRCPQGVYRSLFPVITSEVVYGGPGDDFISGGPGPDSIYGDSGNDILLANTDVPGHGQIVDGGLGNDTIYVLVGDVSACLTIIGLNGVDVVNLIGFGPFSASQAFGITPSGWTQGWIHLVDPIGGGDIYIQVFENGDAGVETINGLLSPNVTFIPGAVLPLSPQCISPTIT